MKITAEVLGVRELADALKSFPANVQRNVLRRATYNAAADIGKAVRKSLPVGKKKKPKKKRLRAAIEWGKVRNDWEGIYKRRVRAVVTVNYGIGPHFHLVEYGTRKRKQKKTGRRTGRMPVGGYANSAIRKQRKRSIEHMLLGMVKGIHAAQLSIFKKSIGLGKRARRR